MKKGKGKRQRLEGNEVLFLDDPSSLWIVQKGSLALFAAACLDGVPEGHRRFFFSAEPGDGLYGFAPPNKEDKWAVIAVALEETILEENSLDSIPDTHEEANREMTELFFRWIMRWCPYGYGQMILYRPQHFIHLSLPTVNHRGDCEVRE